MEVLQINDPISSFAAILDNNEIPIGVTDFALCQICRLTINGEVINNPAANLHWDIDGNDRIKNATLNNQGWFVDNFFREGMPNFLYFMNSFDDETQQGILDHLRNADGGVLYINNDQARNVRNEEYQQNYSASLRTIVEGHNLLYPIIRDAAVQPADRELNFQVHVLFRTNNTIRIGAGFSWKFQEQQGGVFIASLGEGGSNEYIGRVMQCIAYQNTLMHTDYRLDID